MKIKYTIAALIMFCFLVFGAAFVVYPEGSKETSSSSLGQNAKETNLQRLIKATPVPQLNQSVERQMIARRAKLFDQPNKLGYVYLISMTGQPIGYYSIVGKMASLQSYLVPQERNSDELIRYYEDGSMYTVRSSANVIQDADIDGTYGSNVEGVFFFTDNGTYVELPINGVITPIYSDQPLPIKAPKFNN